MSEAVPLPPLPPIDANLYAIHYSSELNANCPDQTPPVSAIVVHHVLDDQQTVFSVHRLAERQGIAVGGIPAALPLLEACLLSKFYEFVRGLPDANWLHWAMRQPRFCFTVLEQRAQIHWVDPVAIPPGRRYDLSVYLKRRFGDDYAPHPRLRNALRANGLLGPEILDDGAAQAAWQMGAYNTLLTSLASKVHRIAGLYRRVLDNTFKCASAITAPIPSALDTRSSLDALEMLARKLRLKGNELTIVDKLRTLAGRVPLADLGPLCDWENPTNAWNSARQRLNKKLKRHGWRLTTDNHHAVISQIPVTGRK